MADPFYLLFCLGPALKALFNIDYLPREEDFKEFTDSQYQKYFNEYGNTDDKLYMLLPENPQEYSKLDTLNEDSVIVVSKQEMDDILNAVKYVEMQCAESKTQLTTTRAKLSYVAKRLPDVFSKDTPYEVFYKSKTHIID